MAIILDDHCAEQGTYHVVCEFEDEDGAGNAPTALTWTLTDPDGEIVNGRQDVSVGAPATSNTITIGPGTDTALIAGKKHERHFLIEWTYNSTFGTGLRSSEEAIFIIDPRLGVS